MKNNAIEITFDEVKVESIRNYEYDDQGRIICIYCDDPIYLERRVYKNDGGFFIYEDQDEFRKVSEYDKNKNIISKLVIYSRGYTFYEKYYYNEEGKIILKENSRISLPTQYEYDDQGRLICERMGNYEKKYTYNDDTVTILTSSNKSKIVEKYENGKLVYCHSTDTGTGLDQVETWMYDASGKCIAHHDSYSGINESWTYNKNGDEISHQLSKDKKIWRDYIYNDEGRIDTEIIRRNFY